MQAGVFCTLNAANKTHFVFFPGAVLQNIRVRAVTTCPRGDVARNEVIAHSHHMSGRILPQPPQGGLVTYQHTCRVALARVVYCLATSETEPVVEWLTLLLRIQEIPAAKSRSVDWLF
jgi:hypothetical protein